MIKIITSVMKDEGKFPVNLAKEHETKINEFMSDDDFYYAELKRSELLHMNDEYIMMSVIEYSTKYDDE